MHEENPSDSQDETEFQAAMDDLQASQKSMHRKWAIIGVGVVITTIAVYVLGYQYREALFRPKPDMDDIKTSIYELSNDPVCRTMFKNIDGFQTRWKANRLPLRNLSTSDNVKALTDARTEIKVFIDGYRLERRRLPIILTHDPEIPADLLRYLKHILVYLKSMDSVLDTRIIALAPPKEAPKDGEEAKEEVKEEPKTSLKTKKKAKATKRTPEERYNTAWAAVTEDHEKWRVFRQGPLPCGKREGEVPPLPSESALENITRQTSSEGSIRIKTPTPKTPANPKN